MHIPRGVQISLNGEAHEVPADTTVESLLTSLSLPPGRVAVERNREIVSRADHARVTLLEGDRLEVVAFVGGG
jgi:thiamine biosynthesis protein ThiS